MQYAEKIRADERERCAQLCEQYAANCKRGSPVSSMAEDIWGEVHALELAKLIRKME